MNITNSIVIKIPLIVEEVVEPVVEEVLEVIVEPTSYATVYWTLEDEKWTYMDTYYYSEIEWTTSTPTDLQNKQVSQYITWRTACGSPVTDLSEVTTTTIEEII